MFLKTTERSEYQHYHTSKTIYRVNVLYITQCIFFFNFKKTFLVLLRHFIAQNKMEIRKNP